MIKLIEEITEKRSKKIFIFEKDANNGCPRKTKGFVNSNRNKQKTVKNIA